MLRLVTAWLLALLPGASFADELFDARGFVQNRAYFGQAPVEHIDPVTGNVILTFTDLVLPGNAGFDLRIQRTYNSKIYPNRGQQDLEVLQEDSWAGVGWTLHLGRVLAPTSARPVIEMPDGSQHRTFLNNRRVGCVTPANTCLITKEYWVLEGSELRLPNGVTYTFGQLANPDGLGGPALYVTEIRDPFGNRVTVNYMNPTSNPPRPRDGIASITQSLVGGQTRTIEFTASDRVNTTPSGRVPLKDLSAMVLKINGVEKARWTYVQEIANGGHTLLREVIPPEGNALTRWKYTYSDRSPRFLLTEATTPYLGKFTYEYTEARLFSGSRVGVRSIVVSRRDFYDFFTHSTAEYQYPGLRNDAGPVPEDSRRVITPCGTILYSYYGLGPNNAGVPAWKVGTLRRRTVMASPTGPPLEQEELEYQDPPQTPISNDAETVGNQLTRGIFVPLVQRRTLTRGGKQYVTLNTYRTTQLNDFGRPSKVEERGELSRTTERTFQYGFTPYIVDKLESERVRVAGDPTSFTRRNTYDLATGFQRSENVYGIVTTYTPTPAGNRATVTDANGNTTRYTHDWGLVREIFTPESSLERRPTTVRQINPEGTVASETRFQGGRPFTTTFSYDKLFRITRTQPPVGDPVITTYDNVFEVPNDPEPRRIFTLTTRGASQVLEMYDGMGRVDLRSDALGNQVDFDRDACGRLSYQGEPFRGSAAENQGDLLTYDPLGRLVRKTHTADNSFVEYRYHDGVDVDVTDEEKKTTRQDWGAFGDPSDARLLGVTDARGHTTRYAYNAVGSLTEAASEGGPTRRWAYDDKNLLRSETHPESGTVSYVYDAAGRLRERRDARFGGSAPMRFCYDRDNRLTRVSLPGTNATSDCSPFDKTFTYDESDNRTSMSQGADQSLFEYDGANRLRRRTDVLAGQRFTTTYDYDGRDNLRLLGYPLREGQPESARHVAEFEHDAVNQVSRAWWNAGGTRRPLADEMLYHPNGALASYRWGDGLSQRTDISLDPRKRVASVTAGSALQLRYSAYDRVGNVREIQDARGEPFRQTFTYDPLDRLTTARGIWGFGRFTYDALGNRLSTSVGGTTSFTYDPATQRLTGSSGAVRQSFSYDPNGNLTSDGARSYRYTPENMLATATAGGAATRYVYDGDNQRKLKVASDGTHFYFHDGAGQVISELLQVGGGVPRAEREYVFAGQRLLASVRSPGLKVSPDSLIFSAGPGGSVSAPREVRIASEGGEQLSWRVVASVPWLVLSRTSGERAGTVSVSVDPARVPGPGIYEASVTVTASDAGAPLPGSPATVPVRLIVTGSGGLVVLPSSLSFATQEGWSPPPQRLDIVHGGAGPASWRAQASAPWMTLSATSGSTPAGLAVSIDTRELGAGTHRGSITVTAPGVAGSPAVIPVSVTVAPLLGECAATAFYCEPFDELRPGNLDGQGGWAADPGRQTGQVTPDPRGAGQAVVVDPTAGNIVTDGLSLPDRPFGGLEFSVQVMSQGAVANAKQIAKLEFLTTPGTAWGQSQNVFGAIRWGEALLVQYGANVNQPIVEPMEPGRWYEVKVRYANDTLSVFVDGVLRFSAAQTLPGTLPFKGFGLWAWERQGRASLDLIQVRPVPASLPPQLLVEPRTLDFSATHRPDDANLGAALTPAPAPAGEPSPSAPTRAATRAEPRPDASGAGSQASAARERPRLDEAYGKLPLAFEANEGQTDPRVRYLARGSGYALFALPDRVSFALRAPDARTEQVELRLEGARTEPRMEAVDALPGRSNYLIGKDPGKWRTNVRQYAKVRYADVYPGIDFVLYGNQRQLEYDFVVRPGADPSRIRLAFEGVQNVRVAGNGDLILETRTGELRQLAPVVYQEVDGSRRRLSGRYRVTRQNEVAFDIPRHDERAVLVIDPVLAYSTYLGGSGGDSGHDVALDSSGSVYVSGGTASVDFPTRGPLQGRHRGMSDAFVTRFTPDGSALVYSTYIGGSGEEEAASIAVNAEGAAFLTGHTSSEDFPLVNPAQGSYGGSLDAWAARLSPSGDQLVYSTYLGGGERLGDVEFSGHDLGAAIAVDAQDNAFVAGFTASSFFPTTGSAFQPQPPGGVNAPPGEEDGFVTRLGPTGAIVYSTYLGGSANDRIRGLAVDAAGRAYVAGHTASTDFPLRGPFQAALNGVNDAFVARLNESGSALEYSTYLGGRNAPEALGRFEETATGLTVDASGSAYVVGETKSRDFPLREPLQGSLAGDFDAFVSKLSPDGSALVYSTYLGGARGLLEIPMGIAVDATGAAYVTGMTEATDFPLKDALPGTPRDRFTPFNAFVTKISPSGAELIYSTLLGGNGSDSGAAVALDGDGNAYVTGTTSSDDFPVVNAFQSTRGGTEETGQDAFLVKLGERADRTLQFSTSFYSVGEEQGTVTLTLQRTGPLRGDVSVDVAMAAETAESGVDFEPFAGTVVLEEGQASATVPIRILDDTRFEAMETFTVTLSNPQGGVSLGTPATATVTIGDDDLPEDRLVGTFKVRDANGAGGLAWMAEEDIPWLSLDANEGTGPSTVTATVDPTGLAAGSYDGTITVTAQAEGSPQVIQVHLTVSDAPPPDALPPVADAFVQDGEFADTNFGGAATLQLSADSTPGGTRESYLSFQTTGNPNIRGAKLRVHASVVAEGETPTALHSVPNTSWSEGQLTWNNRPPRGESLDSRRVSATNPHWYEFDVTSYVQSELRNGRSLIGFVMQATQGTGSGRRVVVSSRNAPGDRPVLIITY